MPEFSAKSGSFDPDQITLLREVFDRVWEQIASSYGSTPYAVETARTKLADEVFAVASSGVTDTDEIVRQVLGRMGAT